MDHPADPERAYGMVWGTDAHFYFFRMDNTGYFSLSRQRLGVWEPDVVPWTYSDAIRQGPGTNVIGMNVEADSMTLLINDQPVTSTPVTRMGRTGIGVAVVTYQRASATVWFDDFLYSAQRDD